MRWTRDLIRFYEKYYYELKEYNVTPFQETYEIGAARRHRGATFRAPFEDQAILNAEFDMAMESLGKEGEALYRRYYLKDYTEWLPTGVREILEDKRIQGLRKRVVNYLLALNEPMPEPKKIR